MQNSRVITFTHSIYTTEVVRRAIADYENICRIVSLETEKATRCVFSDSIADLDLTVKEFANYLVELAISRRTV